MRRVSLYGRTKVEAEKIILEFRRNSFQGQTVRADQGSPPEIYLPRPVGEDPDKRDYVASNSSIESMGYRLAHTLDEEVRELIKGFHMIRDHVYGNI